MWKILIILGLLPVIAYWLARYFLYRKTVEAAGGNDCRISTEEFAIKVGLSGRVQRGLKGKRSAASLAEIAMLAAYERLRSDHEKLVTMRMRADSFAQIVAPFSLLVAVFAIVVGKQALICLTAVVMVNAAAALMKFSTRAIAVHAAAVA
ncbi:MAG: hypothetical protein KGQ89_04240, partial [Verrucomicrobia bacterium]|nr:hypothetical protein [Verrucomicrobiota bacterium]